MFGDKNKEMGGSDEFVYLGETHCAPQTGRLNFCNTCLNRAMEQYHLFQVSQELYLMI